MELMMRYNLTYLEEMQHVPNIGMIIEQIDQAALRASATMRHYGERLPSVIPGEPGKTPSGVPYKSDVDTYIRFLVADAYIGFVETKQAALADGSVAVMYPGATIPDSEIEGLPTYDDPLFEVSVTGLQDAPAGFLVARISMRLTG
jgi:hypothetical protein